MIIAATIADVLNADPVISTYCTGVFLHSAPIGTRCPYIVVTGEDTREEDGVIAICDLTVDIYDYNEDTRPAVTASERVRSILSYNVFESAAYKRIRVWFRSRHIESGDDAKLTIISMRFDIRAIDAEYP